MSKYAILKLIVPSSQSFKPFVRPLAKLNPHFMTVKVKGSQTNVILRFYTRNDKNLNLPRLSLKP